MPKQAPTPTMPVDTLTGMAKLLANLHTQLDARQRAALAKRTNLAPEAVDALFQRAGAIANTYDAPGEHQGRTTPLERNPTERDMFTLTGDRAIWIGVEDPDRPGRGFDIRINDAGDGPIIDVWMMNDADIPGADKGWVPLDPIATHAYAYTDHLNPDLDEELEHA